MLFSRAREDYIEAKLTGGLGNQLFIFAAAYSLAKKFDCKLILDTADFKTGNPRSLEIAHFANEQIEFQDSTTQKIISKKNIAKYVEKQFGFEKDFLKITTSTRIEGYFQSHKYFDAVADEIYGFLNSKLFTDEEAKLISGRASEPSVSVHVRRGDYLQATTKEFHGLATSEYFHRATSLISKLVTNEKFTLFTDTPEALDTDFYESSNLSPTRDLVFDESRSLSSWATLIAMSKGTGIIMSNSSFSWWAAWLMSYREASPVIAPRPWFEASIDTRDLLMNNWMTLDSRP